jgi:hypothetical protein
MDRPSFGADSYDKLSEQGFEQVRLLASHWQSLEMQFDQLISGLSAQAERKRLMNSNCLRKQAAGWTSPLILASMNMMGDPLIRLYLRDFGTEEGLASAEDWPIRDRRQFPACAGSRGVPGGFVANSLQLPAIPISNPLLTSSSACIVASTR